MNFSPSLRNSGWFKLVKFNLVGFINSLSFWCLYELLFYLHLSLEYRVESAWAIAYATTSILAHFLHFKITFEPDRNYLASMWRTLMVYGSTLVLSTVCEHILVSDYNIHHRLAWIMNTVVFGLLNFMALRYFTFKDHKLSSARSEIATPIHSNKAK